MPHMTRADAEPHCVLETWDTSRKAWVADSTIHQSAAAATAAARERGVYRVVLVNRAQRLELDVFAIV